MNRSLGHDITRARMGRFCSSHFHGEKNSKNCLENSENSLKHLSPAAAAQWIK